MNKIKVRFANSEDARVMLAIYAPYVWKTSITFEYEAPSVQEFEKRIGVIINKFPWLICEIDGKTAGYSYASPFQSRAAFQWDVEMSIYLSPEFHRMGIATALCACMEQILMKQGYLNLYSLITHPNTASENFHLNHGFLPLGIIQKTGYKFGEWHDLIIMEKRLSPLPEKPEPCRPFYELDEAFLVQQLRKAEKQILLKAEGTQNSGFGNT